MSDIDNSKILELDLLESVSQVLMDYSEPMDIVSNLYTVFSRFFKLENLEIFVYDENTKTLRDFSRSWVVIEDFHKSMGSDNLYAALAQLSQYYFFVNKTPFKGKMLDNLKNADISDKSNIVLFPLLKRNKPYGIMRFTFDKSIANFLTSDFFKVLSIISNQISLKIQNTILTEQMQKNIDFHDAMKNIAKIIETQYELNYIIPLIGEMVDRFISDHLIYIFLKNAESTGFDLVWPKACRDKKITSMVTKLSAKSKHILTEDGKIGLFPLVGEKELLGCVVAHSNIDKLSKKEIDYLDQLTKQSSITIHRANVYAEVLQHATLDALTGLNNRRQFEIRLKQEVATAKRQGKPLCAMMLDVDFFKSVNDTHGHVVGDVVLKSIASIVKAELREYDIASRYGGEEFAILLPFTRIEEAFSVAQRLRHAVEVTPIETGAESNEHESTIKVTVSIGVNQFQSNDTPQDLYNKADKALYEAKTHGRNKVVIYK